MRTFLTPLQLLLLALPLLFATGSSTMASDPGSDPSVTAIPPALLDAVYAHTSDSYWMDVGGVHLDGIPDHI